MRQSRTTMRNPQTMATAWEGGGRGLSGWGYCGAAKTLSWGSRCPALPWAERELLPSSQNPPDVGAPAKAGGEGQAPPMPGQSGWSPSGVQEILGPAQAMGRVFDFPTGTGQVWGSGSSRELAPSSTCAQHPNPTAGSTVGQLLHRAAGSLPGWFPMSQIPAAALKLGPGEDELGHAWPLHGAGAARVPQLPPLRAQECGTASPAGWEPATPVPAHVPRRFPTGLSRNWG